MKTEDLKYTINSRDTTSAADGTALDVVHVTWSCVGGFQHLKNVPITHPPKIVYEVQEADTVDTITDMVSVKIGTPDSIVMQILEEKKAAIAANFTPTMPIGTRFLMDGRDPTILKSK